MIRFSQAVEYGVLGLVELAKAEKPLALVALSKKAGVPESFLAKIFQKLERSGIVVSKRGKSGGFRLPAKNHKVHLWKIYKVIEENSSLRRCVGESEKSCDCKKMSHCILQEAWQDAQKSLEKSLSSWTISGLLTHHLKKR
ncbi:Rrf2 family transcriptional regulator [Candidatus Peregrinibacteria bacterium]|nr:Rrf2 family transcriptional regulator [Candidatus Peregrinibacteria bacterium]